MRVIRGEELLGGGDDEFLKNLYAAVLNRWPDTDGYRHYLGRIARDRRERQVVIEEVAASEEARRVGIVVRFGERCAEPAPAPAPVEPEPEPAGPLAGLRAELREPPAAPADPALAARLDRAEATLATLEAGLAELRAGLETLHRTVSGSLKRQLCDYVNDLIAIEAGRIEHRLRRVEKHLLERDTAAD